MERLPIFVGLALVALGFFGLAINSDVDLFGDKAARELATARVEIGLMRADNAEAHGRAVARTVQPLVGHSESGAE